ncbi:uncharacterized protein isoform X1 [Musca autumnalis]|uniref:uncharacterized protein isoform X1 n=1 Tax=Musca autumnalis TaxID=221902 RepID=UPI003CF41B99
MLARHLTLECLMENIDIAKHIFGFLAYEDQLNLSRVCKQFKDIIIHFLWKQIYSRVRIVKKSKCNLISTLSHQYVTESWQILGPNEVEELLTLNGSNNIQHFELWCKFGLNPDSVYLDCHNELLHLKALTSLSLAGIILSNYDMRIVSENCPHLELLSLDNCVNTKLQTLIIGHDVNVAIIAKMANLKSFTLISSVLYSADMHLYNYRHIQAIIRNIQTEELHLNVAIYSDNNGYQCHDFRRDNLQNANYLEECDQRLDSISTGSLRNLDIGCFVNNDDFFNAFSNLFQNLNELSIADWPLSPITVLNRNFFELISTMCPQLRSLSLTGYFIDDFLILESLRVLQLKDCRGLTTRNMENIFNKMKLHKFITIRTIYSGSINENIFSSTLQHLELDLDGDQFVDAFKESFPNLKVLQWHNCYGNIPNLSLLMPNLEILTLSENAISLHDFLRLRKLHTLTISKCTLPRYLPKLLQHQSLRTLLLKNSSDRLEHSSSPPMWQSSSTEYTTTKLSNLVITVNLFEVSLNLWLGLLSKNPLLVLTVCFDIFNKNAMHRLLHNLINNEKFPTRIKSIQICGLHIDCKEMKFFLEATLKKLEIITSMVEPAKKHLTMVF